MMRASRQFVPKTVIGLALVLLGGCGVTSSIEQARQMGTGIGSDEAVVILGRTDHTDKEAEQSFTECVAQSIGKGRKPLRLVPAVDFIDQMFPWFEPRLAPTSPSDLAELLAQPGVADRIAANQVRYLVWIDGNTQTVARGGSMTCALSTGGGGCFGLNWWERDSSYEASVWDVKNVETAGYISADANGTSYVAGMVIPIPLIARTGAAACKGLATQLKVFLAGEEPTG